jgi:hypothetical protein
MASYGSYKKVVADQFQSGAVTTAKLANSAGMCSGLLWIYNERALACVNCANAGGCVEQANGKCCLWTVPTGVTKVTFEIWSGGGGGAGHTCCNDCSFSTGGSGGNYATRTIAVTPGWTYTVCAGGSWPCSKSHTCVASMGCRSFVIGNNLSNFCVMGGCGGIMCNGDAWGGGSMGYHHTSGCANCNICGYFGADFGIMGTAGFKAGQSMCRCNGATSFTGQAPIIGTFQTTAVTEAWCSCGCYVNWPAGGGQSGTSSYCNDWAKCCAGGSGQGGSGIVKITFA